MRTARRATLTDGEFNVCGVLVSSRPESIDAVVERLAAMPGVVVHRTSPDGRVVVTVEDAESGLAAETVGRLSQVPGVLSAALVYHRCEGESPSEGAMS
jgi:nitrate reductase NapD